MHAEHIRVQQTKGDSDYEGNRGGLNKIEVYSCEDDIGKYKKRADTKYYQSGSDKYLQIKEDKTEDQVSYKTHRFYSLTKQIGVS